MRDDQSLILPSSARKFESLTFLYGVLPEQSLIVVANGLWLAE